MIPIKNAREIEKMRQACRTASDILDRISDLIRPGITTMEIDQSAADFMREAGVQSAFLGYRLGHRVFPGNICISLNDEIVHGIGSQRRIQYGDIVKLDIGVVQDGWVGDTAFTVPVGMIDDRTERLLRVTETALRRAIEIMHEGTRLGDVCATIEEIATRANEPMINSGTAAVKLLDDGWTVCTADGMPSAHFEHTVLITRDGPEILTWRGKTQLK